MVTIGRTVAGRVERPAWRLYAREGARGGVRSVDGAYLLAAVPAILLHLLVLTRGMSGPAAAGEALTVVAAHDGGPAEVADLAFARQLAFARSVLGARSLLGGPPVPDAAGLLQTARGMCLLAGLVAALLLWVVARRVLPGPEAAAAAVIVAGSSPVALLLHADVDAGALAAFWLVAAAAVAATGAGAGPGLRIAAPAAAVAAVGLAAAVLTAPLAAAGVLALVAALSVRDLPVPGGRAGRVTVVVVATVAAVAVAVLAVARTSSTTAADTVDGPLFVTTLVVGVALVGAGFWRVPRLRPVAVAAAVWLACALWPGSARLTALLLALPPLALLAGGLLGAAATRGRLPLAAAVAVALAFTAAVTTVAWPPAAPPTATYGSVAQWLAAELDPTTRVQADALGRAELVAGGVPADRFVTDADPDAVRIVTAAAGCGSAGPAIAMVPTPGGGVVVCGPAGSTTARAVPGLGPALADNPALTLSDPARSALVDGRVDDRLTVAIAGATASHCITIDDFPPTPGAPPDAPRRTALIAAAPGVQAYLSGQLPPYRPEVTLRPDASLLVHFRVALMVR